MEIFIKHNRKEKPNMHEAVMLLIGVAVGILLSTILTRIKTGYGFFKLEKVSDEEDLYSINVRLVPYQKLNKKKRIVLTRE
jgi:hypothetical protein